MGTDVKAAAAAGEVDVLTLDALTRKITLVNAPGSGNLVFVTYWHNMISDDTFTFTSITPSTPTTDGVFTVSSENNGDVTQILEDRPSASVADPDFATEGVFLCGLSHGPKTIDESISQAYGAVARAATILAKDEMEIEPTISNVIDENCDGCAYCVDPCPFNAITLIEYQKDGAIKKTVEVNEAACKGCGVCMATCPKKGILVRGFRLDQLTAMIDAALEVV